MSSLNAARSAKNDEFYTQWADIEREMSAYLEYDPDLFQDKTVLLPCDDPEWSNFTKFFALHFTDLGLKKLISTSYAPKSNAGGEPTLFETDDPNYDEVLSKQNGRVFTLTDRDLAGDGVINIDDLAWDYLAGDGDFRSQEVTKLRDQADIIVTNPPFSLFRAFISWLIDSGKQFSVIGPGHAVTYKGFFPLIKANHVWRGATGNTTSMVFRVPEGVEVRLGNTCWFTNIEHGRRPQPMQFMTMAENKQFSRHKKVRDRGYVRFDNYDAIDVPYTDAIPSDYAGTMGVPTSFFDRYNPDQFQIVGITRSWSHVSTKKYPAEQILVRADGTRSRVGVLNNSAAVEHPEPPEGENYYEVDGRYYTVTAPRILIRWRDHS